MILPTFFSGGKSIIGMLASFNFLSAIAVVLIALTLGCVSKLL